MNGEVKIVGKLGIECNFSDVSLAVGVRLRTYLFGVGDGESSNAASRGQKTNAVIGEEGVCRRNR